MSAYNVLPYVSGTTKPLTNHELITISWKTGKDGVKRESKCVNVVPFSDDVVMNSFAELMPHIKNMLRNVQASIVREKLEKNVNESLISHNDLSISACITYLEESAESGRMTKESLGNWFHGTLEDRLTVAIANKLGVSDTPSEKDVQKMELLVASYKDKLCALAGGKTAYKKEIASSLIKAIELVDVNEDVIAAKLHGKLVAMRDKKDEELIDLL